MKNLNHIYQIKFFLQKLLWNKYRLGARFEENCLRQEDTILFTAKNVVNLFTCYELDTWQQDLNIDFTLKDFKRSKAN